MEAVRSIPLSRGFVAVVSAADYPDLSRFKWYARFNEFTGSWYAVRYVRVNGKRETIQMGREVLGLQPGDPRQADHENHDTLDNTRSNLRIASAKQNCQNRRRRSDNKSTYKGVSWNSKISKAGRWRAQIWLNRTNVTIGHFADPVEAALAYDARARQEFGEFAYCNFPADHTHQTSSLPIAA
jgi:hypothetical protein